MRYQLLSLIVILLSFQSFCIEGYPVPPKTENTEDFSFKKFIRQPNLPIFISKRIEDLEYKNASLWDGDDSLYFALRLSLIHDYEHALSYYINLELDTIKSSYILHIIQLTSRKTARFQRLMDLTNQEYDGNKDNYTYRFRKRLAELRLYIRDREDNLDETIIFSELLPDYISNKSREQLIEITESLDQALRIEILYNDDNDKVISKAYEEFGDFLFDNFYISNAYMAYSIARYFSKRSNSAQKKVKSTRELMHEQNLLLPSFSRTFSKIKNNRYSFAVITPPDSIDIVIYENREFLNLDELLEKDPPNKDHLPWLDADLVLIVVLFLSLLFTIFVIKRKSKR